MKFLNGAELAGYMKETQAHRARGLISRGIKPKLVIIRDNDSPVILKYVTLKQQYGEDIGVEVEDWLRDDLGQAVLEANQDKAVHGVIVQLPIKNSELVDGVVAKITPEKDVDGLSRKDRFDSATATAINWLVNGYNIDLMKQKIAIVGHGRLVGAPLEKMWRNSGYDVTVFDKGSDLGELKKYSLIVSATGVPRLISSEMISSDAIIVDAGTASEGGVLVGDVDESVRERNDLTAITPKVGGVGPLTVTALFEHVLIAAEK